VLAACFALNMFGRGLGDTYVVFLLPLEREYGWTRSQLTSVYSIYLLMHGVTSPLVGLVFDRVGPRWVYSTGLACMCAAFFLAAGLANLWQFYLFVGGMVGVGVSLTGMVPGSALIARWYRERLSSAIGIAFSAAGVGTIIFVPLTQYLVGHYDWRLAYRVLGGALLVLVPIVAFMLPWQRFYAGHPERAQAAKLKPGEDGWTLRKAMRTRLYWGLCQVFFFTATAMFTVIVQLVAFFVDVGFSPITAASAYGALGLMSAASVMGSGFTSDRFGYRQTVTVTFIGTAAGMGEPHGRRAARRDRQHERDAFGAAVVRLAEHRRECGGLEPVDGHEKGLCRTREGGGATGHEYGRRRAHRRDVKPRVLRVSERVGDRFARERHLERERGFGRR